MSVQVWFQPAVSHGTFYNSPSSSSFYSLAAEVSSLKELSRLELLRALGRKNYSKIPLLPLPAHLQQYVSHYREWGEPPAPVRVLCPIEDRDKEDDGEREEEEEEGEDASGKRRRRRRRRSSGGEDCETRFMVLHRENNRQRLVFLNINGFMLQVCVCILWKWYYNYNINYYTIGHLHWEYAQNNFCTQICYCSELLQKWFLWIWFSNDWLLSFEVTCIIICKLCIIFPYFV